MTKTRCKTSIAFLILLISGTLYWYAQNIESTSLESYLEQFSQEAGKAEIQNTKELIYNFCTTIINPNTKKVYDPISDFVFSSKDSIILYILCTPLVDTKSFTSILAGEKTILKQTNRPDYSIHCDMTSDLDSCNLYKQLPKAFNTIANDLTNLKLAAAYWMSDSSKSTNELANEFAKQYFSGTALCDPKDSEDNSCSYPKTFDHLKTFISQAKSLSKQTTTINVEKLNTRKNTTTQCESKKENYNLIICWLLGSQRPNTYNRNTQSTLTNFSNLLYNEFFRHKLFMSYYEESLLNNIKLQPFVVTSNTDRLFTQAQSQASFIELTNIKTQNTIEQTIEQLRIIQNKFPIHIGLMMYYERLLELRKTLAKIYTPIHQLYYKLRNVQQKE